MKLRAGKRGVCRSCQMNHRWRAYSRPATASRCSLLTLFIREDPRRAHLVLLLAVVVLYGVVPHVVGLQGAARHRVEKAVEAHGEVAVVVRAVVPRALGDLRATSTRAPGAVVEQRARNRRGGRESVASMALRSREAPRNPICALCHLGNLPGVPLPHGVVVAHARDAVVEPEAPGHRNRPNTTRSCR